MNYEPKSPVWRIVPRDVAEWKVAFTSPTGWMVVVTCRMGSETISWVEFRQDRFVSRTSKQTNKAGYAVASQLAASSAGLATIQLLETIAISEPKIQ